MDLVIVNTVGFDFRSLLFDDEYIASSYFFLFFFIFRLMDRIAGKKYLWSVKSYRVFFCLACKKEKEKLSSRIFSVS